MRFCAVTSSGHRVIRVLRNGGRSVLLFARDARSHSTPCSMLTNAVIEVPHLLDSFTAGRPPTVHNGCASEPAGSTTNRSPSMSRSSTLQKYQRHTRLALDNGIEPGRVENTVELPVERVAATTRRSVLETYIDGCRPRRRHLLIATGRECST